MIPSMNTSSSHDILMREVVMNSYVFDLVMLVAVISGSCSEKYFLFL